MGHPHLELHVHFFPSTMTSDISEPRFEVCAHGFAETRFRANCSICTRTGKFPGIQSSENSRFEISKLFPNCWPRIKRFVSSEPERCKKVHVSSARSVSDRVSPERCCCYCCSCCCCCCVVVGCGVCGEMYGWLLCWDFSFGWFDLSRLRFISICADL